MDKLPPGWRRVEDEKSGKVHYVTRHPEVKIRRTSDLKAYHLKGRYQEMELSNLDFGSKKRSKKYTYSEESKSVDMGVKKLKNMECKYEAENAFQLQVSADEGMEMEDIQTALECEYTSKKVSTHVAYERKKLEKAVSKLTINSENVVDHELVLQEAAKKMSAIQLEDYKGPCRSENLQELIENIASRKTPRFFVFLIDGG